jgi:hypothetical protein
VLNYTNLGDEEARNVRLSIAGLPTRVFQEINLSPNVSALCVQAGACTVKYVCASRCVHSKVCVCLQVRAQ